MIKIQKESEKKNLKNTTRISGIYKIINKVNGKYYVGSSMNIEKRWKNHINSLLKNNHHNDYLQRSWNKFGKKNFKFIIIKNISNPKQILLKEQKYLKIAKKEQNKCYNLDFKVGGHDWTEYSRNKLSKSMQKRYKILRKKGIKIFTYKKHLTKKFKKEMSQYRIKNKLSLGKNNPMYGKIHSVKSKIKMSNFQKNRNFVVTSSFIFQNSKTKQKIKINNLKKWCQRNCCRFQSIQFICNKKSINNKITRFGWRCLRKTKQRKISKKDYFNKNFYLILN